MEQPGSAKLGFLPRWRELCHKVWVSLPNMDTSLIFEVCHICTCDVASQKSSCGCPGLPADDLDASVWQRVHEEVVHMEQ